jgi:transposase
VFVVLAPLLDDDAGFPEGVEDLPIEQFVPETGIEARAVSVREQLPRAQRRQTTGNLRCSKNITPILLPSHSPGLNPVEQVWQYLRINFLSNRVFDNYQDIIDAACDACKSLISQPTVITSIGMRSWAHTGQL